MSETGVFLFHRDLRLTDNTALIKLVAQGHRVLPIFIFDPIQIDPKKNAYFSNPAVQFMCESLIDLDHQLRKLGTRLHMFYGSNFSVLRSLRKKVPFTSIAWNEDPSAFARKRDSAITEWATSASIEVVTATDYYLTEPDEGLGPSGQPYKVLSAFWKWTLKNKPVRNVDTFAFKSKHFHEVSDMGFGVERLKTMYLDMPQLALHGGRALALERLKRLSTLKDYAHKRDFPAKTNGTSRLSPYLKFGCVSIREAYWASHDPAFLRELVFRDFYAKVYATDADLQTGKKAVLADLDARLKWYKPTDSDAVAALWKAWTTGNTGFPLVDAGMRELLATGHQHNRVRMLCASVLTKYMWIDWRAGAKFYYTHLVDADIFSNTAGWGFCSSTGVDAVPYFRAPFNPFIQSKKFDPDAEYIKRWVPELANVSAKDIHKWGEDSKTTKETQYPLPVLEYKKASADAVRTFKNTL